MTDPITPFIAKPEQSDLMRKVLELREQFKREKESEIYRKVYVREVIKVNHD